MAMALLELETIKLTTYAVAVAFVCHELTHFYLAWVFRRRPRFVWAGFNEGGLVVDHEYRTPLHAAFGKITPADVMIHAGPSVVGVALGVVFVAEYNAWPPVWLFVGWAVYTLLGVPNDLAFRHSAA